MNKVLYLSEAESEAGLVFATELSDDYFSLGDFYVEKTVDESIHEPISFLAMYKGKEVNLELKYTPHGKTSYVVNTEIGDFYFELVSIDQVYTGKIEELKNKKLYYVMCDNHNKLEEACQKYDFYFIGEGENYGNR